MSTEAEDGQPEAGPSRQSYRPSVSPSMASASAGPPTPALTPESLAAKASESLKSTPSDSGLASPPNQAGWLRFLTLLRELSDTQRLSFTAEILALENYLTTRLRYELAELNELVSVGNTETFIANESYKSNDPAIEQAAHELMKGVELDGVVNAAAEVKMEDPAQARSRVVHVNGLPFLLYVPTGFTSDKENAKRYAVYESRRRHEVQLNILRTMLVALRTITPSVSALPPGPPTSSVLRVDPLPPRGLRPAPGNPPLAPAGINGGAQAAHPAHRGFAIVINLDEVVRMILPLFFLSLKLAFLLWIFGKHASPKKRMLLTCMAVLWVVYEAWSMRNRRATELRRQREREREEIARALRRRRGETTPALNAEGAELGANAAAGPGEGAAADGRRRHHHRSRHASALSPKYWINAIASVGLAAEAREMGLARHATRVHERLPPEAPPTTIKGRAKRALRRFVIGLVLFVGTLVPEVEKRRKRLLEKRERVRSQLEADRLAQIAAAQGAPSAGPASTSAHSEPAPVAAPPLLAPTPTSAVSVPMLQAPSDSMSEGLPDPTPTLATAGIEPPLPPASPVAPGADDISLLAPPTPELQTDEEDERGEGEVDEVGMILF